MKHCKLPLLAALAVGLALVALPAAAQNGGVIRSGIDAWHTPNDGSTFIQVNLPQDFFCPGSAPVDRITLKGEPIETDPPLALGDADTIIQRHNDAFPGQPIEIQVQALCLRGSDTLRVECGNGSTTYWDYSAGLDGEQPITEIFTQPNSDGTGGTFDGEVEVHALITFVQVAQETAEGTRPVDEDPSKRVDIAPVTGEARVVSDKIVFRSTQTPFVYDPGVEAVRYEGADLFVGTGCGSAPVRPVPGTSNFHPGWGTGTPAQLDKSKCICDCKCGRFCRLPVREQALLAQHGVIPPCRRCNCL